MNSRGCPPIDPLDEIWIFIQGYGVGLITGFGFTSVICYLLFK